jgi:hypothetical protein
VAVAFLSNRLLLQKSILGNGRFHLKAARDTNFRHAIEKSLFAARIYGIQWFAGSAGA